MNTVPMHLCVRCGRDAFVAIGFQGDDPAWLCQEHFDAELGQIRSRIDRAILELPSSGRDR